MLCALSHVLVAQDLIKPISGKSFFTEIKSVEKGIVTYQNGPRIETMPLSEVALIEYSETGVEYFNKSSLNTIDPKDIVEPVYKKGNKVYIPFSSHSVQQRSGALHFRELITKDGLWEVVDCEEEAHFILEFYYDGEGRDSGTFRLKDRNGNIFFRSDMVIERISDPVRQGEKMAESLFDDIDEIIEDLNYLNYRETLSTVSARKRGFLIRPEVSVAYTPNPDWNINPSVTFANQVSPHIALGAGVDLAYGFNSKSTTVSLFGNIRTYFGDKPTGLFFDAKFGAGLSNCNSDYYVTINKVNYAPLFPLVKLSLGLQSKLVDISVSGLYRGMFDKSLGVSLNVAYNIQFGKKK
jgi:hypothetical protein